MRPTAPLSDEHLHEALALLRAQGATFMTGGSRCHTTWGYDLASGWYNDQFDEGYEERHSASQASVEATLRGEPESARQLLYRAARKPGIAALLADDAQGVLDSIEKASTYGGVNLDDRLLRAMLRGDALAPDERAALQSHVAGHTFWHFWMNATGWAKTPENGRRGIEMLDRALALLGEPAPPAAQSQRESFQRLVDQP
jgi:hypothetical protein